MEDRIAKLERRCRLQNAVIGAMLLGCSLVVLTGADDKNSPLEKLQVQSLSIVDPNGKPRITLEADETRGTLSMLTSKGDIVLETVCSDDLFEERLYDSAQKLRHTIGMVGATNTVAMRFYGLSEKTRFELVSGFLEKDDCKLYLIDEKQRSVVDLYDIK